jgi:hypothetical protein
MKDFFVAALLVLGLVSFALYWFQHNKVHSYTPSEKSTVDVQVVNDLGVEARVLELEEKVANLQEIFIQKLEEISQKIDREYPLRPLTEQRALKSSFSREELEIINSGNVHSGSDSDNVPEGVLVTSKFKTRDEAIEFIGTEAEKPSL